MLFLAHGWNNDMQRAQAMFDQLPGHLAKLLSPAEGRILTIVGVLWPSIRWADEDNIAGGGASVLDPGATLHAAISESVDDRQIACKLRRAADNLEGSADAREKFVAALRSILPAGSDRGEDPIPEVMVGGDAGELFTAVADAAWLDDDEDDWPMGMAEENGSNGAARWFPDPADAPLTGAGLEGLSPLIIARLLLNLTTFYAMRDRSGNVGARGVADLAARLHRVAPKVRIHLAGHSFGARVMATAAATTSSPISSVTLLQGAFSHYGFAANYLGTGRNGVFRHALTGGHLSGPIVVTHTCNDKVLKFAYAIASRLAKQAGAAIGGGHRDPYGGIGVNGAIGSSEADNTTALEDTGFGYQFQPRRICNLRADSYISGHGKVTGEPVAYALLRAILAGG